MYVLHVSNENNWNRECLPYRCNRRVGPRPGRCSRRHKFRTFVGGSPQNAKQASRMGGEKYFATGWRQIRQMWLCITINDCCLLGATAGKFGTHNTPKKETTPNFVGYKDLSMRFRPLQTGLLVKPREFFTFWMHLPRPTCPTDQTTNANQPKTNPTKLVLRAKMPPLKAVDRAQITLAPVRQPARVQKPERHKLIMIWKVWLRK